MVKFIFFCCVFYTLPLSAQERSVGIVYFYVDRFPAYGGNIIIEIDSVQKIKMVTNSFQAIELPVGKHFLKLRTNGIADHDKMSLTVKDTNYVKVEVRELYYTNQGVPFRDWRCAFIQKDSQVGKEEMGDIMLYKQQVSDKNYKKPDLPVVLVDGIVEPDTINASGVTRVYFVRTNEPDADSDIIPIAIDHTTMYKIEDGTSFLYTTTDTLIHLQTYFNLFYNNNKSVAIN